MTGRATGDQMRRLLLMPISLGRVLSEEKSFERNPVLGNRWLNERGLHATRVATAHKLAALRRRRLSRLITPEDRDRLDRDGFIVKRDFLPADLFAQLVAQIRALRAPAREMVEGDTITRHIALDPPVLAQVPAARQLLAMAEYRNLISYAGSSAAAPMVCIQTILPRVVEGPPDPQTMLHADTFHPTVKAWLFLNDAAADSMPFVYVPGSHRLTPQRLAWEQRMSVAATSSPNAENRQGSLRIDPGDCGALGLPEPQVLAVPANTLVVADTFGFHFRGPCRDPAMRVEIWAFGRRNPFLPWSGLDLWSIGALWLRKPTLYWKSVDLLERAGLGRRRWRRRGDLSAFDPA